MEHTLTPAEALETAIKAAGGLTELAIALGIKAPAVAQWRQNGVPPRRAMSSAVADTAAPMLGAVQTSLESPLLLLALAALTAK